jgi:hypothetical protein
MTAAVEGVFHGQGHFGSLLPARRIRPSYRSLCGLGARDATLNTIVLGIRPSGKELRGTGDEKNRQQTKEWKQYPVSVRQIMFPLACPIGPCFSSRTGAGTIAGNPAC